MKAASSEILQGRGMTEEKRETVIDRKLLELLVCPLTKGPLVYDQQRSELISKSAHLAYPVETVFRSCYHRKRAQSSMSSTKAFHTGLFAA